MARKKISKKDFTDFLINYMPDTLYTLGKNNAFLNIVNNEKENVTVYIPDYVSYTITYSELFDFYNYLRREKTFRVSDYKHIYGGPINELSYVLAIIHNFMSFYSIEMDDYIKAGQRQSRGVKKTKNESF